MFIISEFGLHESNWDSYDWDCQMLTQAPHRLQRLIGGEGTLGQMDVSSGILPGNEVDALMKHKILLLVNYWTEVIEAGQDKKSH